MRIEVGKEVEYAVHRLKDIEFLAEQTRPSKDDWEAYAKSILRMIAEQARKAQNALSIVNHA